MFVFCNFAKSSYLSYCSKKSISYDYSIKNIRWGSKKKKHRKLVYSGCHRVQKMTWFKTQILKRYSFSFHWWPDYIKSYILQFNDTAGTLPSKLYSVFCATVNHNSNLFFLVGVTRFYYIYLPLSCKTFFKIDIYLQCLIVKNLINYDIWGHGIFLLLCWQRELCHVCYYYIFIKLKYKGKSYKWYRKRRLIVLRFGYSHAVLLAVPMIARSKKAGKMKLVFFGTCRKQIKIFLTSVIKWKPMNIYNGRGLRISRQLVLRKFGKVSAYR